MAQAADERRRFVEECRRTCLGHGPAGGGPAHKLVIDLLARHFLAAAGDCGRQVAQPFHPVSDPRESATLRYLDQRLRGRLEKFTVSADEKDETAGDHTLTPSILADLFEAATHEVDSSPDAAEAAGVVYTPAAEIDFMCRLALRNYLLEGPELSEKILDGLLLGNLQTPPPRSFWEMMRERLLTVTICDPSCGTGSFLVRMLLLVRDLLFRTARACGTSTQAVATDLQRFVRDGLFGVELMEGALSVARFRLELALCLVGGTDTGMHEAIGNLRRGDALAPELGPTDDRLAHTFSWKKAFPRIFQGARPGFDIILGNPPYVRHEQIGKHHGAQVSAVEYKRRINDSISTLLGPASTANGSQRNASGRSDLYVYFFELALGLLRPGGALCFVSSDSWLDTEFGEHLQQRILDSTDRAVFLQDQTRRSFESADVNTVITLLTRKGSRRLTADPELLFVPTRETTPSVAILRQQSREVTWRQPGKWGTRYLKSPETAFSLLSSHLLAPLDTVVDLEYGNKPGIAPFFILDRERADKLRIEAEFLFPVVASTREVKHYAVRDEDLAQRIFACGMTPAELSRRHKRGALAYVRWGAQQRTDKGAKHTISGIKWPRVRSVSGNRPEWYSLRLKDPGQFLIPCLVHQRFFAAANPDGVRDTNMFFHGWFRDGLDPLLGCALLNSTPVLFGFELYGRTKGLGGLNLYGYDLKQVPVPRPAHIAPAQRRRLGALFEQMSQREVLPIFDELGRGDIEAMPRDRAELDAIIFDALEVDRQQRRRFYGEFLDVVTRRLEKGRRGR